MRLTFPPEPAICPGGDRAIGRSPAAEAQGTALATGHRGAYRTDPDALKMNFPDYRRFRGREHRQAPSSCRRTAKIAPTAAQRPLSRPPPPKPGNLHPAPAPRPRDWLPPRPRDLGTSGPAAPHTRPGYPRILGPSALVTSWPRALGPGALAHFALRTSPSIPTALVLVAHPPSHLSIVAPPDLRTSSSPPTSHALNPFPFVFGPLRFALTCPTNFLAANRRFQR